MRQTILQLELFPDFVPAAERAPKLTLPWSEREEIDSRRAMKILGVSRTTLWRMLEVGCLRYYRLSGKDSTARILYESLLDYCDKLRVHFLIPARHQRATGRRLRDDQVLPFPLTDTVSIEEVQTVLRCSHQAVGHLIESGDIVAYRLLIGERPTHWRVDLRSVERYVAKLHRMASSKGYAIPSPRSDSSFS